MEKKNWSYAKTLKEVGISYLGNVAQSVKMRLSKENGTMTYCLYLAPWNMSGYQVCPKGQHCNEFCLNGSGHNISDTLKHTIEGSTINKARIRKTRLFYEDRDTFMRLMIHEIKRKQRYAEKNGFDFSIRINGTSDLSPILFKDPESGKNLLELFNNVIFYDYTKVFKRIGIMEKYPNYSLTFSFDGYNWEDCEAFLQRGGNVAVVFYGEQLPKTFRGWKVEDGNKDDMRYLNTPQTIIGLHYHKTANDYKTINGKRVFVKPNTPFVIDLEKENDVVW